MSDRALLEAVAKAAGVEGHFCAKKELDTERWGIVTFLGYGQAAFWNPLTDDGDALRLAVKLKLKVYQGEFVAVVQFRMAHNYIAEEYERNGMDANEATRRAITRAAASIGSGKESAS